MRRLPTVASAGILMAALGCGGEATPTSPSLQPTLTTTAVRFVFLGATSRRADLPASAQACLNGVGATHIHPSWRSFAGIPLQAVPPDRYEMTFTDVPVNMRLSFRINDQNACDENPTGAVIRNVLANDARLNQNTITPGNGDEPGYAFSTGASGIVSQ